MCFQEVNQVNLPGRLPIHNEEGTINLRFTIHNQEATINRFTIHNQEATINRFTIHNQEATINFRFTIHKAGQQANRNAIMVS
jgi:hypothetical protein